MDYGPDYDWDHIRSQRLAAIRGFLIDSALRMRVDIANVLSSLPLTLPSLTQEATECGNSVLLHRILHPDPHNLDPLHWCHSFYPEPCDDSTE